MGSMAWRAHQILEMLKFSDLIQKRNFWTFLTLQECTALDTRRSRPGKSSGCAESAFQSFFASMLTENVYFPREVAGIA